VTNEVGKSVPATLFGTSGIRGRLDEFLTPELAKKMSLSFAAFLENNGTVLVARDVRPQSELIQKAVMSGLSDGGINVLDCRVATTPATLVALKKLRHKGAVMVTGSHVPAPATGLQGMARAWRELFHQPTRQNQIPNLPAEFTKAARVSDRYAHMGTKTSHGNQRIKSEHYTT
jgi:phosphomannomutase